mmetsp:Transcript_78313/g.141315  ORF Transcript_78313/g.141315 Transcript_78313/m.141315 type:complete len:202 (-) Transcript_78313:1035-1640(-)
MLPSTWMSRHMKSSRAGPLLGLKATGWRALRSAHIHSAKEASPDPSLSMYCQSSMRGDFLCSCFSSLFSSFSLSCFASFSASPSGGLSASCSASNLAAFAAIRRAFQAQSQMRSSSKSACEAGPSTSSSICSSDGVSVPSLDWSRKEKMISACSSVSAYPSLRRPSRNWSLLRFLFFPRRLLALFCLYADSSRERSRTSTG